MGSNSGLVAHLERQSDHTGPVQKMAAVVVVPVRHSQKMRRGRWACHIRRPENPKVVARASRELGRT